MEQEVLSPTPPASPPPSQNAPQQTQPMPKKSSLKTVLFILIAVVVAALSGYGTYFVANMQFEQKLNETLAQNKTLTEQVQTLTTQVQSLEQNAKEQENSSADNASWITEWIKREESNPVANPPASLTKCTYKNQTVYYVPSRCCDIRSALYDDKGEAICSPDGGITGKGDGKCSDFLETRTNCEVVWQDSR